MSKTWCRPQLAFTRRHWPRSHPRRESRFYGLPGYYQPEVDGSFSFLVIYIMSFGFATGFVNQSKNRGDEKQRRRTKVFLERERERARLSQIMRSKIGEWEKNLENEVIWIIIVREWFETMWKETKIINKVLGIDFRYRHKAINKLLLSRRDCNYE